MKLKKKSNLICDSMENEKQVLKIKIPRGFPTGGTLKSEVLKPDIGHNNIKSIIILHCKCEMKKVNLF